VQGAEQPRFILASASPRRRELLERLGARFEIAPAVVEEDEREEGDPEAMARANAALKADWASCRHPSRFALAADTIVCLGGRALNKPADMAAARTMLRRLSGRPHMVFTGYCLTRDGGAVFEAGGVRSEVFFKRLDEEAIDRYLALVDPLDKAGAYGIQEGRDLIVERLEGSLTNVMGLPLEEVGALLRRHELL